MLRWRRAFFGDIPEFDDDPWEYDATVRRILLRLQTFIDHNELVWYVYLDAIRQRYGPGDFAYMRMCDFINRIFVYERRLLGCLRWLEGWYRWEYA